MLSKLFYKWARGRFSIWSSYFGIFFVDSEPCRPGVNINFYSEGWVFALYVDNQSKFVLNQKFWFSIRYKVQPIFEPCTLYFGKFAVVPYKHSFSERFSGPRTLLTPLFRKPDFKHFHPNYQCFLPLSTYTTIL